MRVSRRTFYELFEDRQDCFLVLSEDAVKRASVLACDAAGRAPVQEGWRGRIRAGLSALLMLAEDEPALGSLLVVDALSAGPKILERRAHALDALRRVVDEGRSETKTGHGPSPLTAEGVVGAVLSVIHARMLQQDTEHPAPNPPAVELPASERGVHDESSWLPGRSGSLIDLLNPLMGMIVLPYLGRAAANR